MKERAFDQARRQEQNSPKEGGLKGALAKGSEKGR
jgi:hypothetical protein